MLNLWKHFCQPHLGNAVLKMSHFNLTRAKWSTKTTYKFIQQALVCLNIEFWCSQKKNIFLSLTWEKYLTRESIRGRTFKSRIFRTKFFAAIAAMLIVPPGKGCWPKIAIDQLSTGFYFSSLVHCLHSHLWKAKTRYLYLHGCIWLLFTRV